MRVERPESIRAERVIPAARRLDADRAVRLVESLMVGGLSTLDITVEASGGLDSVRAVAECGATIGAGTVTSIRQASKRSRQALPSSSLRTSTSR